jgi:hypothetical protein
MVRIKRQETTLLLFKIFSNIRNDWIYADSIDRDLKNIAQKKLQMIAFSR